MKNRKILTAITIATVILSVIAASAGLFTGSEISKGSVLSVWGEDVALDGRGLYAKDSVSIATQARAQDLVTFLCGIPLLIISFVLYSRGNQKGALLYPGTMGYFLYTYAAYCFLSVFNMLFLVYTSLFSLCLFGFILALMNLEIESLAQKMAPRFHRKTISIYLFILGILLLFMWLGRIVPAMLNGTGPSGIDHYSTLPIQVLDLSLVVPLSVITSVLLWQKKAWGYILSGIVVFKALTLALAILAMIIAEYLNGVHMNPLEIVIFLTIIGVNLGITVLIVKAVPS